MFKTLTPVFAIIVAGALFFTYVQPTFENMKAIQDESSEYADAIDKAEQLHALIDEKIAERNQFSPGDLERLEVMLPDRVKEVEFLIVLDTLAVEHDMQLSSIEVEGGQEVNLESFIEGTTGANNAQVQNSSRTYETFDMSFVVAGQYDDFREFLRSLEENLQLVEVMGISFEGEAGEGGGVSYGMNVRTYTLSSANN